MFTVIILLTARELTFLEANASKAAPTWLDVNKDNQTAKVLRMPVKEDLDYDIEEHLIVELYSK